MAMGLANRKRTVLIKPVVTISDNGGILNGYFRQFFLFPCCDLFGDSDVVGNLWEENALNIMKSAHFSSFCAKSLLNQASLEYRLLEDMQMR
ncbi:hypothetical protein AV654_24025 [Paenibacillus elgii]|uniref:Uncharacterized protein n=1 Tax=Paenibacillus elgii TaxID=189691 RepID=A0A163WE88_9BACL|nr:hypothetical protein AV654_24025 [Paenibacillus elgii]